MILKDKTINFLGDSITQCCGASCMENGYVNVLAREYGLKKANNYGIGGTRIAKQLGPTNNPAHDAGYCDRVQHMDPDADIIVVFGGTNDFGHGNAPLGSFDDRHNETFYGACHVLFRSLLEKYPDKPIVVLTPLHRLEETFNDRKDRAIPLKRFVEIIKEVAEYYSLPVLDLFACGGMQPNVPIIRETYMPDGLHPNDAGHQKLARQLGNFLLSL